MTAVDEAARTCDVEPLNEDAPLFDIRLQSEQAANEGVVMIPAVGSWVIVTFTSKADGLGLGLNICRTIIESHGGHLAFENRDEGGAVFFFTLPIAP